MKKLRIFLANSGVFRAMYTYLIVIQDAQLRIVVDFQQFAGSIHHTSHVCVKLPKPPISNDALITMTARFLINDGQHRRAAIDEALKECPELGDEMLSIVFFIDAGLRRSQQMFADLNRHAIRPTKSLGVLYDRRAPLSQLACRLAGNRRACGCAIAARTARPTTTCGRSGGVGERSSSGCRRNCHNS